MSVHESEINWDELGKRFGEIQVRTYQDNPRWLGKKIDGEALRKFLASADSPFMLRAEHEHTTNVHQASHDEDTRQLRQENQRLLRQIAMLTGRDRGPLERLPRHHENEADLHAA